MPGNALTQKPKEIFESLFGKGKMKEIQDAYKEEKGKGHLVSVRDILELHSPTTQCNNVVGVFVPGSTDCWICGFEIETGEQVCEHVLPVAQAKFFWNLYEKGGQMQEDILRLEYGWAHKSPCNSVKLDKIFIRRTGPNISDPVVVDERALSAFLEKIRKPLSRKIFIYDPAGWLVQRFEVISDRLQAIADAINRAPALLYLAGLSSFTDPREYDDFIGAKLFGDDYVPTAPPKYTESAAPESFQSARNHMLEVAEGFVTLLIKRLQETKLKLNATSRTRLSIRNEVQKAFGRNITSFEELQSIIKDIFTQPEFLYTNFFIPYAVFSEIDPKKAYPVAYSYYLLVMYHTLYVMTAGKNKNSGIFNTTILTLYKELKATFLATYTDFLGSNPSLYDYYNNVANDIYPDLQESIAIQVLSTGFRGGKKTRRVRRQNKTRRNKNRK